MEIEKTQIIKLDQLPAIAKEILSQAEKQDSSKATVIALHGDLGSGKTTLTQEIAKNLGINEKVISPTFVIMKNYELKNSNLPAGEAGYEWKRLIHIDAYRLDKSEELIKLGWEELLNDKNNLIIIEWPENVPECIPKTALKIELLHSENDTRTLKIKP